MVKKSPEDKEKSELGLTPEKSFTHLYAWKVWKSYLGTN